MKNETAPSATALFLSMKQEGDVSRIEIDIFSKRTLHVAVRPTKVDT
jgi:hypothetical protein